MDLTGRGPSNPLPHKVVQSFMYQLCKGLAHLHSHGVMHRDLKAENLLLDARQRVWLLEVQQGPQMDCACPQDEVSIGKKILVFRL